MVLTISQFFTLHQMADVLGGKSEQIHNLATAAPREQKGGDCSTNSSTAKHRENVRIPSTRPLVRSRTCKRQPVIVASEISDCIEVCHTARRRCERLVTTGLAERDVNVAATIATTRDCARIVTLTTQLFERGSNMPTRSVMSVRAPATSSPRLVTGMPRSRRFLVVTKLVGSAPKNVASSLS